MSQPPAKLIILSGPSGVGKSTVLDALLAKYASRLRLAVSATTRDPRPGEIDAKDYHFLSLEEFEKRKSADEFLEYSEVFSRGYWYGTLRSEVDPSLNAGQWVILEIDVDGAQQVLRSHPSAVTIFLRPSTLEELERRLRSRGTETEQAIERRLAVATKELEQAGNYRHSVVNDRVEDAVAQIENILAEQGLSI